MVDNSSTTSETLKSLRTVFGTVKDYVEVDHAVVYQLHLVVAHHPASSSQRRQSSEDAGSIKLPQAPPYNFMTSISRLLFGVDMLKPRWPFAYVLCSALVDLQ